MNRERILVVEDERDLREGLRHNLELEGYDVEVAADGDEGLRLATDADPGPDLVVLDLMLPGRSGFDVLDELRRQGRQTPVIILSARGRDADKVRGLELGADDYVTKPFGLAELLARIRAVLRRCRTPADEAAPVYRFPGLTVDFGSFSAERDGVQHRLSRYEAEILRLLIRSRGRVVTRRELLQKVWGYVHLPTTRTVDNHIARLRKKIEADVEHPRHVVTVHGIGYRFDSEPLEEER